jgi:GNAT superfamily N-acetyltransferase
MRWLIDVPSGDALVMSVHEVGADELVQLKDIRLRALREAPGAFGSRYADELGREPAEWLRWVAQGRTFVIADEEGWHGLVAVVPDRDSPSIGHVISMWVDPSRRGQGLGGLLLEAAIEGAREIGAQSIKLGVVDGNVVARRMYEGAGFRPTGHAEPLRSDPSRSVIFLTRGLDRP